MHVSYGIMKLKSIANVACILAMLIASSGVCVPVFGSPVEDIHSPRTIVMFGANWCAPCRVELRQLSSLAAAASPDRLVVAWIDREPLNRPVSPWANVVFIPPFEAQREFRAIAGGNYGLPVAAMFDRQGKLCNLVRYPLSPEVVVRLKAGCAT